jgi:hypothetical protein
MTFWQSQYRRVWLPYVVRPITRENGFQNNKVCAILNRNYQPLSNIESVGYSTGTEHGQSCSDLLGSIVRFKTDPAKFKDVWFKRPETVHDVRRGIRIKEEKDYLYDDRFHSKADVENYFKRLRNLFNHNHELLSLEEIDLEIYGERAEIIQFRRTENESQKAI